MRGIVALALFLGTGCAVTTQQHLSYPRTSDAQGQCEVSGKWKLDAAIAVVSAAAAITGAVIVGGSHPTSAQVDGGGVLGAAGGLGTVVFGASAIYGVQWNGECEEQTAHSASAR
jgi:hypothetical protein